MTAEQIRALNGLKDEEKTSLLEILTGVEKANEEITRLRKSQPTDSQRVVEKVKWEEMEKAIADRDSKVSALEAELAKYNISTENWSAGAFDWIFALLEGK